MLILIFLFAQKIRNISLGLDNITFVEYHQSYCVNLSTHIIFNLCVKVSCLFLNCKKKLLNFFFLSTVLTMINNTLKLGIEHRYMFILCKTL